VARFYLDRGHSQGRPSCASKEALRRYPDSGRDAELLLTLGETQLEMGQPASAKQTFLRVTPENASTVEVKRAELFSNSSSAMTATSPRMNRPHG